MCVDHPIRCKKVAVAALAVALAAAPAAPAFYWVGWPGVKVQEPPQIISQQIKVDHRDPTVPPDPKPPGGGDTENPPGGVPEPASVLLAGIGLAGVAGVRWVRKRRTRGVS